MRRVAHVLAVGTLLSLAAISASPARAGGGDVAAGLIGGLAVGTLFGATIGGPHYYPPAYAVPEPVYGPRCYWAAGEPYWDDYSEVWTYQRVRVCE